MNQSVYRHIREVYNTLGKSYIRDSKNLAPVERLRFRKSFPAGSHILDVGCAGGRDGQFFVAGKLKVTGVDASDVFIREARKTVPQASFIQGDLLEMSFPKDRFDGIWAQAVLLHLKRKDVPKALQKFYKMLKPGGLLHIRVKRGKGEGFIKDSLSGGYERFYTYFSKKEMEKMLRDAGFTVVYSRIFPDQLKRMNVEWIAMWAKK